MRRTKELLTHIRRHWIGQLELEDAVNAFALGLVVATGAMLISVV